MRIKTLSIGLLLFVVLAVHPVSKVEAGVESDAVGSALPDLAGFVSVALEASPALPFLIAGLGFIHLLSVLVMGEADDGALSKTDLLKTQKELMNKLNDIDAHISHSTSKIISELSYKVESQATLEDMRKALESFKRTYDDKMKYVLSKKKNPRTKKTITSMLDEESSFRILLRDFITSYIKPSVVLATSGPTKLFFDFILQQNELLAVENQDCNQDSLHYKIFKSYIYISKVLTDSYVMVLSAHVVRYQAQIRQKKPREAAATKTDAEDILQSFKNDMKILMDKTKWALENSSRDIKNCGSFELKEGETYARLPYVTTVLKKKMQSTINFRKCISDRKAVTLPNYKVIPFMNIAKNKIPVNSYLEVYSNPSDSDRPLSYVKYGDTTLGHADGVPASRLTKTETGFCNPDFIKAYNNKVGISTQRVSADPDNVITGVRFKVRKNVLYIDIQQGKFISELEVDPETVHWKETPENPSQVTMLAPLNQNKIEITDYEVKEGNHLNAIQFAKHSGQMFGLYLNSENNPSRIPSGGIKPTHEIKLNDRDDPAMNAADADTRRLISSSSDPKYGYIHLQATSFTKDLSRTTIPYIDTREVVTNPPSPVSGIGIYHEAAKGDGGLLALKLIQPRLTKYVDYSKLEKMASPKALT